MREIVDEQIWKDQATARGEDAVFDRDLYRRVHQHFWAAFRQFCDERGLPGTHDSIRRYLRQKPDVLVVDDRFFALTPITIDFEFRVDELTPEEVAAQRKRLGNRIRNWFRRWRR